MNAWHLTIPSKDRLTLFPTESGRREAVHTLTRVAGRSLALFCIADDHLHLVVVGTRAEAGRLSRAVNLSIGHLATREMASGHIEPVANRRHLESLVRYVLNQPVHHGLPEHPALWTMSVFPDLVGARILPRLTLRLKDLLPRFYPRTACEAVGLGRLLLRPASAAAIREIGAVGLATAAGATLAARPDLTGMSAPVVAARGVVGQLAAEAGLAGSAVADALGLSRRSVRRLSTAAAPTPLLEAVRRRVDLERHVDTLGPSHTQVSPALAFTQTRG